ncbi:unnamed protein product [Cylicostephanus goldi]|uniref:Aldehyde dehydrogenase domain-containing protein n=1 Tax=Cylicostephanus goldi TaxID=71465 RepID=A0A3P6RTR9_CYLGO|nr:unnamed protein product [Cylicostephanus goldi]
MTSIFLSLYCNQPFTSRPRSPVVILHIIYVLYQPCTSVVYQFFHVQILPDLNLLFEMLKDVIEQLVNSPNNEHKPLTNFINNEFVETDDLIDSVNPATGQAWIRIPNSGEKEVNEAVAAANRAFPS